MSGGMVFQTFEVAEEMVFWCESDVVRLDKKNEIYEIGCCGEPDHESQNCNYCFTSCDFIVI